MRKNIFRVLSLALGGLGAALATASNAAPRKAVEANNRPMPRPIVIVDGQRAQFTDAQPYVDSNILMVPLRGVFEMMGARVHYSTATDDIDIHKGKRKVELAIGKMNAYVNGRSAGLDLPSLRKNKRVWVPLRFVAQALGAQVVWEQRRNTALITSLSQAKTPIEVRVITGKPRYARGEAVKFTITARNASEEDQTLRFNTGKSFEITVTPVGKGTPRWEWGRDKMFTQAVREQVVQPGETVKFEATWDQKDNNGKLMPRSEYSVSAMVTTEKLLHAAPITVRLVK